MRGLLPFISGAALAATLLPAVLYFADAMGLAAMQGVMLVATLIWFATAPLWMERTRS